MLTTELINKALLPFSPWRRAATTAAVLLFLSGCVGPFVNETPGLFPEAVMLAGPGECNATQPLQSDPLICDRTEKDTAKADLNNDGYVDVVVARKRYLSRRDCRTAPVHDQDACDRGLTNRSSDLRRSAIILINDSGVFRDRTSRYSNWTASTEHMTARDVVLADLNNDGFVDAIFANTAFEAPRIYLNRGNDGAGNWLGFDTNPITPSITINVGTRPASILPDTIAPFIGGVDRDVLFCAVTAGDIDGDGDNDLYFSNYDPTNTGTADVLLINNHITPTSTGNPVTFTDETETRLGDLRYSAFGTAAQIVDIDGRNGPDIVKISTLYPAHPFARSGAGSTQGRTAVLYNRGNGTFHDGDANWLDDYVSANAIVPYMFDIGDFNGDGLPDIFEVTDGYDVINFGYRRLFPIPIFPTTNRVTYPDSRAVVLERPAIADLTRRFGGNIKHLTRGEQRDISASRGGSSATASSLPDDNVVSLVGLAPLDVQLPVTTCKSPPHLFNLFRNSSDSEVWVDAIGTGEAIMPGVSGPGGDSDMPWQVKAHDFELTDIDEDGRVDILFALCEGYMTLRGVRLDLSELTIGRSD